MHSCCFPSNTQNFWVFHNKALGWKKSFSFSHGFDRPKDSRCERLNILKQLTVLVCGVVVFDQEGVTVVPDLLAGLRVVRGHQRLELRIKDTLLHSDIYGGLTVPSRYRKGPLPHGMHWRQRQTARELKKKVRFYKPIPSEQEKLLTLTSHVELCCSLHSQTVHLETKTPQRSETTHSLSQKSQALSLPWAPRKNWMKNETRSNVFPSRPLALTGNYWIRVKWAGSTESEIWNVLARLQLSSTAYETDQNLWPVKPLLSVRGADF